MANTPPKKKENKLMSTVIDEVKLRRIEITTDYPSTVNCGRLVDHDMMKMMMVDDDYDGDDDDDGDNDYDGDDNGDDEVQCALPISFDIDIIIWYCLGCCCT